MQNFRSGFKAERVDLRRVRHGAPPESIPGNGHRETSRGNGRFFRQPPTTAAMRAEGERERATVLDMLTARAEKRAAAQALKEKAAAADRAREEAERARQAEEKAAIRTAMANMYGMRALPEHYRRIPIGSVEDREEEAVTEPVIDAGGQDEMSARGFRWRTAAALTLAAGLGGAAIWGMNGMSGNESRPPSATAPACPPPTECPPAEECAPCPEPPTAVAPAVTEKPFCASAGDCLTKANAARKKQGLLPLARLKDDELRVMMETTVPIVETAEATRQRVGLLCRMWARIQGAKQALKKARDPKTAFNQEALDAAPSADDQVLILGATLGVAEGSAEALEATVTEELGGDPEKVCSKN